MGGFVSVPEKIRTEIVYRDQVVKEKVIVPCRRDHRSRNRHKGKAAAHKALRFHPNFSFAELPENSSPEEVAEFIIDTLANFVSPPKIDDEDEEFECIDVANAIRERLKPEIMEKIKNLRGKFMISERRLASRRIDFDD